MAKYRVDMPDGTSYMVEVPDPTPDRPVGGYSPAVVAKAKADVAAQPLGKDVNIFSQIGSDLLHGGEASAGHALKYLIDPNSLNDPNAAFPTVQHAAQGINSLADALIAKGNDVTAPTVGALPELVASALPVARGVQLAGDLAKSIPFIRSASQFPQLLAASAGRVAGAGVAGQTLQNIDTSGQDPNTTAQPTVPGWLLGAGVQSLAELLPGAGTAVNALKNAAVRRLQASVPPAPPFPATALDPATLAQLKQDAVNFGFTPHPMAPETEANQAARNAQNSQQLTDLLKQAQTAAGGYIDSTTAAQRVAADVRPALEAAADGVGGGYDQFFSDPTKRFNALDPNFQSTLDSVLKKQQELPAVQRDKTLIATLNTFKNPQELAGFDPNTGTIPASVAQTNLSQYSRLSKSLADSTDRYGYGQLSQGLKDTQRASLSGPDAAQLDSLREQFKNAQAAIEAAPNKDVALYNQLKANDPNLLQSLATVLPADVQKRIGSTITQDLITQTLNDVTGGRVSQLADAAQLEKIAGNPNDLKVSRFLQDTSVPRLAQVAGGVLDPESKYRIPLPVATGNLPRGIKTLFRGLTGVAGSGISNFILGHPFLGYAAGHAAGAGTADDLVNALLQKGIAPLPAHGVPGNLIPGLTGAAISPAYAATIPTAINSTLPEQQ